MSRKPTPEQQIAALVEEQRAVWESMTEPQRALVNESRDIAMGYANEFVTRTRELDEMRRRLRDFAATWHTATGHEYSLDDCRWSTCLDLLTGQITTGAQLAARTDELPVPA